MPAKVTNIFGLVLKITFFKTTTNQYAILNIFQLHRQLKLKNQLKTMIVRIWQNHFSAPNKVNCSTNSSFLINLSCPTDNASI